MYSILLILLIIVAVMMTGLILLQKSEGSGMSGSSAGAMMGGAMSSAAAGNFLTKTTAWLAFIFFGLCLALAIMSARQVAPNEPAFTELQQELVMPTQEAPEQIEIVVIE